MQSGAFVFLSAAMKIRGAPGEGEVGAAEDVVGVIGVPVAVSTREVGMRMMRVACPLDSLDHNTVLRGEDVDEGDCECVGHTGASAWEANLFAFLLRLARLLALGDSTMCVACYGLATLLLSRLFAACGALITSFFFDYFLFFVTALRMATDPIAKNAMLPLMTMWEKMTEGVCLTVSVASVVGETAHPQRPMCLGQDNCHSRGRSRGSKLQ